MVLNKVHDLVVKVASGVGGISWPGSTQHPHGAGRLGKRLVCFYRCIAINPLSALTVMPSKADNEF
jgi:hypothetical protein